MDPQLIPFIVDVNIVFFSIILWMWALASLGNHQKSSKHKVVWVIWILVITLVPFTGPLIYLVTFAIKGRKLA